MPEYEFRCDYCGHVTSKFFKLPNDLEIIECENCKESAERILSLPAFDYTGARTGFTKKNIRDYDGKERRKGKVVKVYE
jgi:putative FmdB family regulatory protein